MTDLRVGDTGPTVRVEELSRTDFVKYAGASGDFNPIHFDDEFATAAGNERVFAQGMLTAGIASTFMTEWVGIAAVTAFETRFEDQVWPGETLVVSGEVVDVDHDDGEATVELTARTADDRTVLTGSATVTT